MFSSLVLDVDSTLCGIEGIDFLAERRGAEIGAKIAQVTERAMRGELALENVYGERLAIIRPTRDDVAALRDAYIQALAPGAADAIVALRSAGVRMALVSGGILQAIQPLARSLGFEANELTAVAVSFDERGRYLAYDTGSPLATQTGKATVVRALIEGGALPRPVLAVGDGSTDVFMREAADTFAAFVGFARRDAVVARADLVIESFEQVARIVLGNAVE